MQRLFAGIGLIYQRRNCRKIKLQEEVISVIFFVVSSSLANIFDIEIEIYL